MELTDLVGNHILSGVDRIKKPSDRSYYHEDYEVINFVLDGKTYTAIEDPEDGYRSCLQEIFVSEEPTLNTFPGQEVVGRMADNKDGQINEILELIDVTTGKVVLAIGTANTDDYYPYWVADFNPENMSINK